jgi:hypothetical protein
VLHQRHHNGVEDGRLGRRRKAALELEEGHVSKRDAADQVDQFVAMDDDPIGGAVGDPGTELPPPAQVLFTVSGVL